MQTQVPPYPNRLREFIEIAGYKIREVHRETDIPERTLYDWLKGNRKIPLEDRRRLARLLGCSVDDLAPVEYSNRALHLIQFSHGSSQHQPGVEDIMNRLRRLLLRALAAGSTTLVTQPQLFDLGAWERLARATINPLDMDASTLQGFEQVIQNCWQLTNSKNFGTVQWLLPELLPQLAILAEQDSPSQSSAASLASQGYQIAYVIHSQNEDFGSALHDCEQAYHFGQLAKDPNLQAAALIRQGVTHLYRKRPYQTLFSYQKALQLEGQISPLVKARLHAGLAEINGKLQRDQEASENIGKSHDSFPDDPEKDPAALYVHFTKASVYLHQGLALIDLHKPQEALTALAKVDGLNPKFPVSERSRVDILNQQALAAGQMRDLEGFRLYLEAAVGSAIALKSELRYSEAWDIYTRIKDQRPHEQQIKSLSNVFAR